MLTGNEIINTINSRRIQRFLSTSEIMEITGMSKRSIKYRMLKIKAKYEGVPSLLKKENRQWLIHLTLVDEFLPLYNLKSKTPYTLDWQSIATWNPLLNYDVEYHVELVKQIKVLLPENIISYAVELDSREINHTHLISDAEPQILDEAVKKTLKKFIGNPKVYRCEVAPIINKYCIVEYMKKAPMASGFFD